MKRIDTLTDVAKIAYDVTLDIAETLGMAGFSCSIIQRCKDCPFFVDESCANTFAPLTPVEWTVWANEEVEEDNNNANE